MKALTSIVVVLIFIIDVQQLVGQKNRLNSSQENIKQNQERQAEKINSIFHNIEIGLATNNIELLSKHISKQLRISLRGSETGYFSENQAMNIIESYFNNRRIIDFNFANIKSSDEGPYATGEGHWNTRGKQEKFLVYVIIAERDNRWVITQLKIY